MEDQPRGRAPDTKYHQGEEDRDSAQHKTCSKHDQSHFKRKHQKAPKKKRGSKELILNKEEEETSHLPDTTGVPLNSSFNGCISDINVKSKSQTLVTAVSKTNTKRLEFKKNMDLKHDKEKALDVIHHEGQPLDKKDSVLQNGIAHCGLITNGYSSKDNDGSGSEGGYTTPKKRKARCNNKSSDNVNREKKKDMHRSNTAEALENTEKGVTSRLDGHKATHKLESQPAAKRAVASEASAGDSQRKNSDSKAVGTFSKKTEERQKAKLCSPSNEDSWTLFKPPPVFPVDNSSAKIVPKISYASKVKENLNKAVQSGGEVPPPTVRPSQVPMSAMKTITSASFTNGPVSGNGTGCPSVGTFFAHAAGSVPQDQALPCGENVASPLESNCSFTNSPVDGDAYELRKCTLLIYPLNMQPVLPSARHLDPPDAQTNHKTLGDIFQNQWGLSFINEPNLTTEEGSGPAPAEDKSSVVKPQCQLVSAPSFLEPSMFIKDSERRTCSPLLDVCSSVCDEETKLQLCGQDGVKVEGKSSGSAVSCPSKDHGAMPAQGHTTTVLFGSSKEQVFSKDIGRRRSWGAFDVKAAVAYHTKEMEFLFNLQKRDPKKVVIYDLTVDGPAQ
ncbi:FMR1-interacting protein NUFIP2 isoform 1-T1 [Synchiropus picturatus]